MTKKKLIILLFGLTLNFSGWTIAKAIQQKGIEEDYRDLSYKSVSDAILETESYYKKSLGLPKKLPPLDFTYSFGRFNKENENLEIEYLSEKQHFNYIINVIPSKNETELLSDIDSQVFLKDGTQANYLTSGKDGKSLITFMFKKNNWTYILSIEERLLDNPLSTMMEIANSF